jgi:hypothetical protein
MEDTSFKNIHPNALVDNYRYRAERIEDPATRKALFANFALAIRPLVEGCKLSKKINFWASTHEANNTK